MNEAQRAQFESLGCKHCGQKHELNGCIGFAYDAGAGDENGACAKRLNTLPKYPYHTWDREDSGQHQQLIGIEDAIEAIRARQKQGKVKS